MRMIMFLRKYFWDKISTLNKELAEKFIDHAIKERNKQKITQKKRFLQKLWNKLTKSISTQDKKEEHYSCLFQAEKFIRLIERKREYKFYELSKEEMENF